MRWMFTEQKTLFFLNSNYRRDGIIILLLLIITIIILSCIVGYCAISVSKGSNK